MFNAIHSVVLILAALTLPFSHTNVDLGFVVITPSKAAVALLLVVVLAEIGLSPRRPRALGWQAAWLGLFAVSVAVSTSMSLFRGLPPQFVLTNALTWISLIALTALLTFTVTTERQLRLVIGAYTLGAVYVAVSGLLGQGFSTESMEGVRIGGEGGNSNEAAFHLVLGVASALGMGQSARAKRARLLWAGAAALLIVAVGATLSRSGLLALGFMGAFWAVRFRRFDVIRAAVPALILVSVAIAFMPESVGERIESMAPSKANQDTSILSRKELLPLALRAFAENPVIGVGLSGWVSWALDHQATHAEVIHNAQLHVAAEQGLLGLIPFAALIVIAWWNFNRGWRTAQRFKSRAPSIGEVGVHATYLQVGYLGCLVVAQFQPAMRYKGLWLCFALAGIVVSLCRSRVASIVGERSAMAPAMSAPLHT